MHQRTSETRRNEHQEENSRAKKTGNLSGFGYLLDVHSKADHTTHNRNNADEGTRALEKDLQRNRKRRRKRTSSTTRQDRACVLLVATRQHVIPISRRTNSSVERVEYAQAGSPVHRTVFRRELSPRGREYESDKERGQR